MNIVEVGFIATPILGAVGGASAVKESGTLTTVSALVVGVCVGIGVIALTRFSIRVLSLRIRQERPEWLVALLVAFVIPIALPIVALSMSRVIVSAGLHL